MIAYIISTLLFMIFLLAAGAFFSMTETAYTSLDRIKLRLKRKKLNM